MSEDKATKLDLAKLEGRLSTQEEQMKTHEAKTAAKVAEYQRDYHTGWQTIQANMAELDSNFRNKMEEMKSNMAHRETRLVITVILVVSIATTILGLVLSDNRPTLTYLFPHPTIETPTQPP